MVSKPNKLQLIQKYAKKFAINPKAKQPIFEGVHYAANGTAYVTNRQYMLRIRNSHAFDKPTTIHAVTGVPIEGNWPDVDRVFPSNFENEITIDRTALDNLVLRVRCMADVTSRLDKKRPVVILTIDNGVAYLRIRNEDYQIEAQAFFGNASKFEPSKRALNAEYLYTALSLFKDANADQVLVKLRDPLDPILLTDGQDIDVLILPYRVPEQ
jgi:hypothetical protein